MLINEELTREIIGGAIEVYKELGPGLLESAYEGCLCHELHLRGLKFQRQVSIPITYKQIKLDCSDRADVIVEKKILIELKAIAEMIPIHEAQPLTFLKITSIRIGLLLNFHVPVMKDGIIRRAV